MKIKIGLETHVQLNSLSKLFCPCANPVNLKEEAPPNSLTCPTCLGMPGSKPVLNKRIVELATKVALALNCKIAPEMYFSRKTYFYPDMSKNYQITQYEIPLASEGHLEIESGNKKKKIVIRRIHIEEDPAKVIHVGGLGGKYVLVDYNRSGIPLIEIVTEPDFESPQEARLYLQKLTTILEYLGVYDPSSQAVLKSDGNISLYGDGVTGNRVEVKNITGAKEVEEALKYEVIRQNSLLTQGIQVKMETRMWNPDLGSTQEMRGKEAEAEYGYIFEPDLPKFTIQKKIADDLKGKLPELPDQKYQRFIKDYKLPEAVAESIVSEIDIADLFEYVAKKVDPKIAGGFIAGDLKKTLNWNNLRFKQIGLEKDWITDLLKLFTEKKITDKNTELAVRKMVEEKKSAKEIVEKYNLLKTKVDLESVIKKIIENNKKPVDDYKSGEKKALEFLVGLVMKETRGQVDATEIRDSLVKVLGY